VVFHVILFDLLTCVIWGCKGLTVPKGSPVYSRNSILERITSGPLSNGKLRGNLYQEQSIYDPKGFGF